MASRGRTQASEMTKKLRLEGYHERSGTCTWKIVVQSQACTFECYFPGNGERKASQPWMVLCVALDMLMSWKLRRNSLSRKRRLARACRSQVFVQNQARECLFFTLALSMLVFSCCLPVDKGEKFILVGPCCNLHLHHSWLAWELSYMSQATFLYVCHEIRPVVEKEDTDENCCSSGTVSYPYSLVSGYKLRLLHNWPLVRCI